MAALEVTRLLQNPLGHVAPAGHRGSRGAATSTVGARGGSGSVAQAATARSGRWMRRLMDMRRVSGRLKCVGLTVRTRFFLGAGRIK